jgi:hypothetical protein
MWTDPLAGMLGMESLKLNPYGRPGQTGDILSIPPALSTLDKMMHIPAVPLNVIQQGGLSNNDINALKATPLLGNAVGIAAFLNSLKN